MLELKSPNYIFIVHNSMTVKQVNRKNVKEETICEIKLY